MCIQKIAMQFYVFILILSLIIAHKEAQCENCSTGQMLETKLNHLLMQTEQYARDLSAKEKRIESLENFIRRNFKTSLGVDDDVHEHHRQDEFDQDIVKSSVLSARVSHEKEIKQANPPFESSDLTKRRVRRSPSSLADVAFYSYLSTGVMNPRQQQTIIFDIQKTTAGNAYNNSNGIFTASRSGLFYFSWTIYSYCHGYVYTEIVKNGEVYGNSLANSEEICDDHSSTTNVVLEVVEGDSVFIRTNSKHSSPGNIVSDERMRSAFSGFIIN